MPTIKRFVINNFKGIQKAELNIDARKKSNVITLIGLNESGKTTILEALSHFSTGDRALIDLLPQQEGASHLLSLIPISKRAAFTGRTSILADISFSDGEFSKYIRSAEDKFSTKIKIENEIKRIVVTRAYEFEDSVFVKKINYWEGVDFKYKLNEKGKNSKFIDSNTGDIWQYIVAQVSEDLYELVYFPTFIVDVPDKIYVYPHLGESDVNIYYRKILDYILKCIDPTLSIQRHVLDRLEGVKNRFGRNWFSALFSSTEKIMIDSVMDKIESAINKEVLGNWSKVFRGGYENKRIKLDWHIDTSNGGEYLYVSFYITDGFSRYLVNERSLGFRWFFFLSSFYSISS